MLPFILAMIFNLIDYMGTINAIYILGFPELNPVVNFFIDKFGIYGLTLIKLITAGAITFLYKQKAEINWLIVVIYSPVVILHTIHFF